MANKPFEIQDGIKIQAGDDIINSSGTSAFAVGESVAGTFLLHEYNSPDEITTPTVVTIDGMSYGGGNIINDSAFGPNSSRVTLYEDGMFAILAVNADIESIYYGGETGADGGGTKTVSSDVFSHRGYYARRNLFKGDDLTVSQIVISKSSTMTATSRTSDVDNDDFTVSGLTGSNTVVVLNVYWEYGTNPDTASITTAIAEFIDRVLFNVATDRDDNIADMRTAFYAEYANIKNAIENEEGDYLDTVLEFFQGYQAVTPTGGSGYGAVLELYVNDDDEGVYRDEDVLVAGTGYEVSDTLTVLGTVVGGATPANDVTITVTSVNANGGITDWNVSGTAPGDVWPLSYIVDGDEDQYDIGNFIGTDRTRVTATVTLEYRGGNSGDQGYEVFPTLTVLSADKSISVGQWVWFEEQNQGAFINWNLSLTASNTLVNGDQTLTLNADGSVTFPDGTIQTTAYTGTTGDANVWVQTFESVEGAPDDVVAAAASVEYDVEGNLICLFSHYIDFNFMAPDNGSYFSVAKIATTGTILWQKRFGSGFRTDGWGLAVDRDAGFIYIAGTDLPDNEANWDNAILTKIDLADGDLVWSKIYQVIGLDAQSPIVDVASDGNPVMVGYLEDGDQNYIATTKIDSADGSVIWSRKFDGQGYDNAYGMGVGPNGEVVTVGAIDQYINVVDSYSVTPQTGSGVEVLVINRSDLSNDTFTTSWKVSGSGITGYADVTFINSYSGLTSTVRQGSGATFTVTDNGNGTYAVQTALAGTNYLAGHKIKILGTDLGGATPDNDCIITVDTITLSGGIVDVNNSGTAAGTQMQVYSDRSGTNHQTGSGLVFSLSLDSGSTYTEHPYTFQSVGTNYVTGDVVVIPGTQLGGTSPANDLTATVSAFEGGVTDFNTFSGAQQTTTYRIIVAETEVDFSADGTWTLNNVDVDPNDRMLVIKYNSAGDIQWQKAIQFDDGYACQGADCDIDSAGNIYVTGQYDRTVEEGVALSILKLNSSGVKQWSRRVTGNCDTFGTSIVVGADDCLYLSGITAIQNPNFPGSGSPYADTHSVLAKYSTAGAVLWQRLLENSSTWSFTGAFLQQGASNLAVKDGYVALSGGYGDLDNSAVISASVAQVSADGTTFSVGEWDFVAANFSGTFFDNASDLTVVDAGKIDTDFSGDIIVVNGADMNPGSSDFLIGTVYREVVGADDRLVNSANQLILESTGTVTLPKGGTISEGIVTSNPTIQLTPAGPDVASQKLVIKGGFSNSRSENGITVSVSEISAVVSDVITVNVYSGTRANQLLYWWIYPIDAGIGDSNFGTVTLDGDGDGDFTIQVDSDDYEFTVRVSPENNNYDPDNVGVESLTINGEAPAYASPYHLHLTTGNLSETSIFLGTDDHNVRTTVDGGIQVTTQTTYVEPNEIIITGADVSAINSTYGRAPANPPTWTLANPIGQGDPYIQFVDGQWGIFAPDIDTDTPIYINTGTLYAPLAQWNTNPPLGSVAPTGIYIYGTPPVQEWKFGPDGGLTLPSDSVIQSSDAFGSIKTVIAVPHTEDRDSGDWDTATYSAYGDGNGQIVFVDPGQSFRQYLTQRLPDSVSTTVTVNGNISLTYTSNNIQSTQITLYVNEAPATNPTTITSIVINTVAENRMVIAGSDGSMEFISGNGLSVNIESKLTGDVNIRAGDDIVIQAGSRFRSDSSGGDVDINAGRGGDADHDDSGGDGGDLDIIAGRGGDASADYSAGDGGVTTIRAGSGGTANSAENRQAGFGANLNLYAGAGGNNDGEVGNGNEGGNVNIYAGASTNDTPGGAILLQAGASGGNEGSGSITLRTKTTGNVDRDWIFDYDGGLTLPLGNIIDETAASETITLAGAGLAVVNQTYIKTSPLIYTGTDGVTIENQAGDVWVCLQDNDAKYTSMDNLITWIDGTGGLPAPTSTLNTIVRATSITVDAKTWSFGVDGKLRLPTPGDIVDSNDESFLKDIPQNYPTGFSEGIYALQASDRGRHILIDGEDGNSITVPTDASAPMPIGSTIVLVIKPGEYSVFVSVEDSNAMVIHGAGVGSNMIYELGAGNGGAMATLVKIGTDEWMISGTGLAEWQGP